VTLLELLRVSEFPAPEDAHSFTEYKRTAIQWAGEIESALSHSHVALPQVAGRSLYRPLLAPVASRRLSRPPLHLDDSVRTCPTNSPSHTVKHDNTDSRKGGDTASTLTSRYTMCVCVCVYLLLYMRMCVGVCVCVLLCVYVCEHICVCVCMYRC
jgi:hypothetical protein